jgi:carboxymethylenebutenolidase
MVLAAFAAAQQDPVSPPKPTPPAHGELSEQAFKALHELKKEAAPKPTGTMVDVGGAKHYLALPKDKQAPLPAVIVIHESGVVAVHAQPACDATAMVPVPPVTG